MSDRDLRTLDRKAAAGDLDAEKKRWLWTIGRGQWTNFLPDDARVVAAVMTAGEKLRHGAAVRVGDEGLVLLADADSWPTSNIIGLAMAPALGLDPGEPVIVIMHGVAEALVYSPGTPRPGTELMLSKLPGVLTSPSYSSGGHWLPNSAGNIMLNVGIILSADEVEENPPFVEPPYYAKIALQIGLNGTEIG